MKYQIPAFGLAITSFNMLRRQYHATVGPILRSTVTSRSRLDHIDATLRNESIKYAFTMRCYAQMLHLEFPAELAMLAGAFARLYDDMLDESVDPSAGDRLSGFLASGSLEPRNDVEALVERLYSDILFRLRSCGVTPPLADLQRLHEYQLLLSRADRSLSHADLCAATLGKGRHAALVLLSLVHNDMSSSERRLAGAIGEVVQLIDDYSDLRWDLDNDVMTSMTTGVLGMPRVSDAVRCLARDLQDSHGSDDAAVVVGLLSSAMNFAFFCRLIPPIRRHTRVVRGVW